MDKQPRWLDIEEQLYPETTMTKRIIIQNQADGLFQQLYSEVTYISKTREIDITDAVANAIGKLYSYDVNLQVLYYDQQFQRFRSAGEYPFDQCCVLPEEFSQAQIITIRLQAIYSQKQQILKKTKQRTIKQVLQKVSQWRKMHNQNQKKISLDEAARIVGIPKRTLDDYYSQIRLGQKYDFNFETNLNEGIGVLRKFVKDNHERKQQPFLKILQKFKKKQT